MSKYISSGHKNVDRDTFLSPEDGPQWPKHVVARTTNRIQDSRFLTYPTPSLITYNTTGMMHLNAHS